MQLKTSLSKIDIAKYCKNAQERLDFNSTNLIDDIFEKIQKNYHIAIIFDEKNQEIIGAIVCKIEHDFFCYKICEILDFYISNQHNEIEIMELLNDWLKDICRQFLCKKIIFESFTKNKFEHKLFLKEKFILEKFKFIKEI
jgi:hypothetical protein